MLLGDGWKLGAWAVMAALGLVGGSNVGEQRL